MKAIRDINTKLVSYLFSDGEEIELTENGMKAGQIKALDIRSTTHEVITVPAPERWSGGMWKYDDGWIVANQDLYDSVFASDKADKSAELTAYVKQYLSAAMNDYSEWEAILWPILIQEAEQFAADGTVGEYMAAEIGVKYPTAADLATIVFQRKEAMKQLRAGVVLTRQRKEAQIEAAETVEDLNKITIQEGWPE